MFRQWRNIGLSASLAHLWARVVCLSWKPSVAMELTSRARGCPISIDLTRYNGSSEIGHNEIWPLEEWALWNIDKADVLVAPRIILLNRFNQRKLVLPTLRELQLQGRYASDEVLPIEWEAPSLRSATLSMVLLPRYMAENLYELHLRVYAAHTRLTAVLDFLRACSSLELLDVTAIGEWSHEDNPNDLRLESVRRAERAQWKEHIHLDRLKRAKITINIDQAAVDLFKPIVAPSDLKLSVNYTLESAQQPVPRPRVLLDACARELDCALYDTIEMSMQDHSSRRSRFRLHLASELTPASYELLFPSDKEERAILVALLPSYIATAVSNIRRLLLDASVLSSIEINETFGALGRALTGVTELKLVNMDFGSAAVHLQALRQNQPSPALPALQTLRITDAHTSETHELYQTRQWWDTISSALVTRKESGLGPLSCLRLDGHWVGRSAWDEGEDAEGQEELKEMGLVKNIVDERMWALFNVQP